jgi:putative endonuclease
MRANQVAAVYIITNRGHTVLYTGVTDDLYRRVHEHRLHADPSSFTARYNADRLVWFETLSSIVAAIAREKQIKGGSRADKMRLVEAMNPEWKNLAEEW